MITIADRRAVAEASRSRADFRDLLRSEAPGAVLVVLPHAEGRDELNDDALDLVAGGSNPECVKTDSASRSPEGHS